MELLSNLDLNVFYAIQRKSHIIYRYVMNFTFERRVDKKKDAKENMANSDKTKSNIILPSKTLIQI